MRRISYGKELSAAWKLGVLKRKNTMNLELSKVSSLDFGNDSKMTDVNRHFSTADPTEAIGDPSPQIEEFSLPQQWDKLVIREQYNTHEESRIFSACRGTPDTSHKDQTSQVVRYVMIENQEVRVEEYFIDFIETKNKTAEGISNMISVLEAKREEFGDDALIYAKSLREELEISFEPPKRIRWKHIFGNGSKDVQLPKSGKKKKLSFQETLDILQDLPSETSDVLTDEEVSVNNLLEFSLDSYDDDKETEKDINCSQ
ncbi:hypothetical protein TNCV_1546291 [Trichonephila clavipes]|nr:hypothetical protein TNCV_1546291 [Trichonephila clavipes]